MVKAILDGRKTVTRRVVKPQPEGAHCVMGISEEDGLFEFMCGGQATGMCADWIEAVKMPYKAGDILYVRETWGYDKDNWLYKADYSDKYANNPGNLFKWHPSIHMPKKAARIFLWVKDIRVERLQDITAADILAEGLGSMCAMVGDMEIALQEWRNLWDSTIPKHPNKFKRYPYFWNDNPWVWVIEFERISREEIYDHLF